MSQNEAHDSVELDAKRLKRLKAVTRVLDDAVEVPVLGFRVGLDPLLGLFPGAGDVVSAGFSGWMVVTAARMGATPASLPPLLLTHSARSTLAGSREAMRRAGR